MAKFHYTECRYAECRYAECRYAERRGALILFLVYEVSRRSKYLGGCMSFGQKTLDRRPFG